MPGIAAAVLAFALDVEAVLPFDRLRRAGLLESAHQPVALGIPIRRDVVRDLTRGVTEPHAPVESRCAQPDGPVLVFLVPAPEPHMMPLARTAGDRLLEGEVLLAAE